MQEKSIGFDNADNELCHGKTPRFIIVTTIPEIIGVVGTVYHYKGGHVQQCKVLICGQLSHRICIFRKVNAAFAYSRSTCAGIYIFMRYHKNNLCLGILFFQAGDFCIQCLVEVVRIVGTQVVVETVINDKEYIFNGL